MESYKITELTSVNVPERLRNIPQPPKTIFVLGHDVKELLDRPSVTIVGSRKVSTYGKIVAEKLAGELASAGILIISGLAIGVDSLAHKAALESGGLTLAVLPTSLDKIYPPSHYGLATQIIQKGGALLSEYPPGTVPNKGNFIERNRIASGLADALLVTEAAERSGSLHTANFALEQGRPVLAVPGNITSPTSVGTNNLIKAGATPVTSVQDVLYALGLELKDVTSGQALKGANESEQTVLDLLFSGINDGSELLYQSKLEVSLFNQTLTMLEIRGHIRPLGNNRWTFK
jgi:DNA processing protein